MSQLCSFARGAIEHLKNCDALPRDIIGLLCRALKKSSTPAFNESISFAWNAYNKKTLEYKGLTTDRLLREAQKEYLDLTASGEWVGVSTKEEDQKAVFSCWNCGKDGHVIRDCEIPATRQLSRNAWLKAATLAEVAVAVEDAAVEEVVVAEEDAEEDEAAEDVVKLATSQQPQLPHPLRHPHQAQYQLVPGDSANVAQGGPPPPTPPPTPATDDASTTGVAPLAAISKIFNGPSFLVTVLPERQGPQPQNIGSPEGDRGTLRLPSCNHPHWILVVCGRRSNTTWMDRVWAILYTANTDRVLLSYYSCASRISHASGRAERCSKARSLRQWVSHGLKRSAAFADSIGLSAVSVCCNSASSVLARLRRSATKSTNDMRHHVAFHKTKYLFSRHLCYGVSRPT